MYVTMLARNGLLDTVTASQIIATNVFALVIATFMRRSSERKPTLRSGLDRTIEMMMTSFSRPYPTVNAASKTHLESIYGGDLGLGDSGEGLAQLLHLGVVRSDDADFAISHHQLF